MKPERIGLWKAVLATAFVALTTQAADYYWIATGGLWSASANWSATSGGAGGAGVPGGSDTAIFDSHSSNAVVNGAYAGSVGAVDLRSGYVWTVTQQRSLTVAGSFSMATGTWQFVAGSNATLSVGTDMTVNGLIRCQYASKAAGGGTGRVFQVGGNLVVGSGGRFDGDGMGYPLEGEGPGAPINANSAGGGSHGGEGGIDYNGYYQMPTYGSITNPVFLGSASGQRSTGVSGGGAIVLAVTGSATNDGTITVRGANSTGDYSGAGAGGSINLAADSLAGAGLLDASGGTTTVANLGNAGGGGGRIAVRLGTGNSFGSVVMRAFGGPKVGTLGGAAGAAGTIYLKGASDSYGRLVADNNGVATLSSTLLYAISNRFDSVLVTNVARLGLGTNAVLDVTAGSLVGSANCALVPQGGTLEPGDSFVMGTLPIECQGLSRSTIAGDLVVSSNSLVSHFTNGTAEAHHVNLRVHGNLVVANGGRIDVTSKGFQNYYGLGKGSGNNSPAAHGGDCGRASLAVCYGSVTAPRLIGSGGGQSGAYAGGAIELVVSGVVSNDGQILADGASGTFHYSGSGGSILITAGSLKGSGLIRAAGGNTTQSTDKGGGGRIAVILTNDTDFGSVQIVAPGGTGAGTQPGAAGTVYLKGMDQAYGTLVLDNTNLVTAAAAHAVITTNVTDAVVGSVLLRNRGKLRIDTNQALVVYGSWSNGVSFQAAGGSTVTLAGTNTCAVFGTNQFYNLTCTNAGKRLVFEAGRTNAVLGFGTLTLKGVGGDPVLLDSTAPGTRWGLQLLPNALQDVAYVSVMDSDAQSGQTVVAPTGVNRGNNQNWNFASGAIVTWTGGSNTLWSQGANWDTATPPTTLDTVIVPVVGSGRYPALDANVQVAGLTNAAGTSLRLNGWNLTLTGPAGLAGALVATNRETVTANAALDFTGGSFTAAQCTVVLAGAAAQTFKPAANVFSTVRVTTTNAVTVTDAFQATEIAVAVDQASVAFQAGFGTRDLACSRTNVGLTFAAGAAYSVSNLLLRGGAGAPVTVRSSSAGSAWYLAVTRWSAARYVDVKDSNATGGQAVRAADSTNSGNNQNWDFGAWSAWNGSINTSFSNPTNWTPQGVPGPADSVLIDGGYGANAPVLTNAVTVRRLTLGVAQASLLTLQAPLTTVDDLTVGPTGVLQHADNSTSEVYVLNVTVGSNLTVATGGRIDVTGLGYDKGYGPGSSLIDEAAGGSHAGQGGRGYWAASIYSNTYGSALAPTNIGSGGGNRSAGTPGGGAIRLQVGGVVTLDGNVLASGVDQSSDHGGAGAGGSVWISAPAWQGAGTVRASGGEAQWANGAGGGGGRVALYATGGGGFGALAMAARGGDGTASEGAGGTVYLRNGGVELLRIDNGGLSTVWSATVLPPYTGGDPLELRTVPVTFTNAARGLLSRDCTVGDIVIGSGCFVTLSNSYLTVRSRRHYLGNALQPGNGDTNRVDVYSHILWTGGQGSVFIVR